MPQRAAVMKGGDRPRGSAVASDAFFPFVTAWMQSPAGATAIVQPGGSMRDAEVIAAADEHGLAMVTDRPPAFPPLTSSASG